MAAGFRPPTTVASAEQARREFNIEYALLASPMDAPCPARSYFSVRGYPTLVLIDRNGKVLYQHTGGEPAVFSRLEQILSERLPPRAP